MANSHRDDASVLADGDLFAAWAGALEPVLPDPALRERVLARVRGESLLRTVRAGDGWMEFLPGIEIKMLYRDEAGGAKSFLARLQPGVTMPPHGHGSPEECLVIEGEVTMGEVAIRAGDYHLAEPGARHEALSTRTGAVVFLRAGFGQHVPEPFP